MVNGWVRMDFKCFTPSMMWEMVCLCVYVRVCVWDENDDWSKCRGCDCLLMLLLFLSIFLLIGRGVRSKLAMSMHSMVMVHGMHRCCMSMMSMGMVQHSRMVHPKWSKPKPMDRRRCRMCRVMELVLERPRRKQSCTQAKAVSKTNKKSIKQNFTFQLKFSKFKSNNYSKWHNLKLCINSGKNWSSTNKQINK